MTCPTARLRRGRGWRSADAASARTGTALWAEFLDDYVLAVLLGLVFPYFALAPMRGLCFRTGIVVAANVWLIRRGSTEAR